MYVLKNLCYNTDIQKGLSLHGELSLVVDNTNCHVKPLCPTEEKSMKSINEKIIQALEYKDGVLYRDGKEIGNIRPDGYREARVLGVRKLYHHFVWLVHNNEFPSKQIDHIDHNRANNRIENLRQVTHTENGRNQKLSRVNTSGTIGVYHDICRPSKKWYAKIKVNQKQLFLGRFEEKEDAIKAREHAERIYNFHKNHGEKLCI